MVLAIFCSVLVACAFAQNLTPSNNNIAFELPDLTKITSTETGEFQIEAFKSVLNDQIIKGSVESQYVQLIWVSLGNIKLLKTVKNASTVIFNPQPEGYYALIQTLTEHQREILAKAAQSKYGIVVSSSQIVNLILSKFSCTINLFDQQNNQKIIIIGEVRNFHNYPLRIDFTMPIDSNERKVFEKRLDTMNSDHSVDMQLFCSVSSSGQLVKTNTLTISGEMFEQLGIGDKLFGPSNTVNSTVYVTREQLANLASEMYSSLSIVEVYQIQESQFSEAFVQDLIKQVSLKQFQTVPFDQSLEKLSKYKWDFGSDLKPDEIKKDLGSILNIITANNKSHITVNNEMIKHLIESGKLEANAELSFIKLFKIGASVGYAKNHNKDWAESDKTLDDQLRELNTETKDDVKWQIEGSKVVPKSLNVAQIVRGNFQKTLVFQRIRRQFTDAPFHRDISVYISQALPETDGFEKIMARLDAEKKNVISMLDEQEKNVKSLLSEKYIQIQTARDEINELKGAINDLNNTINLAKVSISNAEGSLTEKELEFAVLQTSVNTVKGQLIEFTGSNHCILANGDCPSGYTNRINVYMKSIRMYGHNGNYLKAGQFGSSFIQCHDKCGQHDEYIGDIQLVTCCK